jgi:hypothetical protein
MEILADLFDAPPSSDGHADLRNTAWMGGHQVEGRYLLGMLTGTNLFRFELADYFRQLNTYISTTISERAAAVFCDETGSDLLIPYLRMKYERDTNFPRFATSAEYGPGRSERIERGIEYLLHNLVASYQEIAYHLGTTEKQVMRLNNLKWAKQLIDRHTAKTAT